MRARLPASLAECVVFFGGWMLLFAANYIVGSIRNMPSSRGEAILLASATAAFVVSGGAWLIRPGPLCWTVWFAVLVCATVAIAWFRPERPQGTGACLLVMWMMGVTAFALGVKDRRCGEPAGGRTAVPERCCSAEAPTSRRARTDPGASQ
jgi:hypothetical protein